MMKTVSVIAALLMAATISAANAQYAQSGGFFGSRLSMLIPSDRVELTDAGASSAFSTRYDQGNRVGLSINGGYQWLYCQRYTFGLQAAISRVFARTNGTELDGHINTPQVAFPVTFSLALRPGLVINHFAQLFGLLGATAARISMSQMYDSVPLSINSWRAGLLLGLGVSVPINRHSELSFDYQYEYYSSISQFATDIRNNFNVQLFARVQNIGLSYSYFFAT